MIDQQKIPYWTAVLMSINIIVGGGIYAGPQNVTAIAGNMSFSAWLIAALLVFPVVWGVSRAPYLFPGQGGFYNYAKNGISENAGFIAQWLYMLGYMMGTTSAMVVLLRQGFATRLGFSFAIEHPYLMNALLLIIFSLLNLMPVGLVSRIQAGATLLKLTPLLLVIPLLFIYWDPNFAFDPTNLSNLPLTIPTVIFGFLGFEACCGLSHLLKDGPESVGKVVLMAFLITAALYSIFHIGLLHIMGQEALSQYGAIAFPEFLGLSSTWLGVLIVIISGSILLSYANSLFGLSLTNVQNVMALFEHRGHKGLAAAIQGVVVWTLLCFVSDIQNIFAFTIVGVGTSYFLTVIAVLRTSYKRQEWGQVFIMCLGFISCLILYYYCWIDLGGTALNRLFNLAPIILMFVLGAILHKIKFINIATD